MLLPTGKRYEPTPNDHFNGPLIKVNGVPAETALVAVLVTDKILVASVIRRLLVSVSIPVTVVGLFRVTSEPPLAISRLLNVVAVVPPIA